MAHKAAALDAPQEALTYVRNCRKDGTKFDNLLCLTPITSESSRTNPNPTPISNPNPLSPSPSPQPQPQPQP